MTSKLSKFILFILLLSGVCTGTTYSQICAYSVSGQVTDPVTHLPVSGAGIGLYQSGFSDTVYTDAGGNYNYSYYTSCDSMNVYILTRLLGCQYSNTWLNIPAGDTAYHSFETCVPEPPDTTCSALLSVLNTSGNTISYSWSGNSSPVASVVSVTWSFGDGQTRNGGDSGTYTYPTHGSYTPCVNITWSNGCVANSCRPVNIPPPYTSCTYKFSGYVKGVGGQAIANSPVTVTLPSAPGYTGGTHVVYTNANGYYNISSGMPCELTDSVTIATSGCGSNFSETVPLVTGVRNYTRNFYTCQDSCHITADVYEVRPGTVYANWNGGNSNGAPVQSTVWTLGNGNTWNRQSGYHGYAPGTYTLCATATWASGCVATDCRNVTVSDSTENQCVFEITGQVTDPQTGQPAVNESVEVWNQGAQNSQFVLTDSNGVYRYTHHFSCDSSQRFWVGVVDCGTNTYHYLEVFPGQPYNRPLTTCGSDSSGCGGGTVNVSSIQQGIALSYNVPGANDFIVTFGDGTGTFFSPTQHVYADSGVYEVCVHAYVSNTCSFDTCFTVSINRSTASDSCQGQAMLTPYGTNGVEFGWNGHNTLGLNPVSVTWDFGDGDSSSTTNGGIHYYDQPGTYTACVTLTWGTGCVATDCRNVTVSDSAANQCIFEISGQVTDPQTGQPAVNEAVEVWNNGTGILVISTDSNGVYSFTRLFSCDSLQRFWVRVLNCGSAGYHYAEVLPGQPYNLPLTNCGPGDTCRAQALLTPYGANGAEFDWNGYNSYGLNPISAAWDFGDGHSTTDSDGIHYYDQPGTYTACVTLTWGTGCVATDCRNIEVGVTTPEPLCGFVFYSDDSLAASCTRVYLMNMDSNGVHTVADTYTGVDGYYCFYSQPAGTYTVLAIPCDSLTIAENLLPTYLGNVLYWQNALQTSANPLPAIRLIDGQQTQGPGSISGIVVWGDDKAPGDPAVGIRVLLLDGEGNPIGYSVTDAEGFYSFAHLPPGTYRIYPEAAGYITYPILVTLTAENPDAENLNFGVGFNVFMGIQEAPVSVKGLYPNPASEITTLSFSSKQSGAGELRITDLSGKTVLSRTVNVIQGAQNIPVALPQIGAGMYTLTLTLNGQQTHVKLIKQ